MSAASPRLALSAALAAALACEPPPETLPDADGGSDAGLDAAIDAAPPDDEPAPENPHLAASTWPIYHGDSYAQHRSTLPAVEGAGAVTVERVPLDGVPVFVLFDPDDDVFAVSRGVSGARLWKIDRETLEPVSSVELAAQGTFAGVYGFVDAGGDAVLGVGQRVIRFEGPSGTLDELAAQNLAAVLSPDEALVAVSALYSGELAFVGSAGTVGVIDADLDTPPLATLRLAGRTVSNALALDEQGGIYLVTDAAATRVDWSAGGLVERWSHPIEAPFTEPRPGRLGVGSGTTPALMGRHHVVLADDAESMNLVVLDRDVEADVREVCKLPVFDGEATTDNAIVVSGNTMIVEQNLEGRSGVARIDLLPDGHCEPVWVADVLAPSCVPTLSTASGLVYVYTSDGDESWSLTGLDLETGETRFSVPTGSGLTWDNFYAAVTVGPDARIYLGVLGGLLVIADE